MVKFQLKGVKGHNHHHKERSLMGMILIQKFTLIKINFYHDKGLDVKSLFRLIRHTLIEVVKVPRNNKILPRQGKVI